LNYGNPNDSNNQWKPFVEIGSKTNKCLIRSIVFGGKVSFYQKYLSNVIFLSKIFDEK